MTVAPEPLANLSALIVEASESLDYLLPLPSAGSMVSVAQALQQVLPLTDQRLDVRLLFSTTVPASSMATPDHPLGNLAATASTWYEAEGLDEAAFRFTLHSPAVGMVVIDKATACLVQASEDDTVARAQTVVDRDAIPVVRDHFEHLWETASLSRSQSELLYEHLLPSVLPAQSREIAVVSANLWDDLLQRLNQDPSEIHRLTPRKFEELVAHLLEREGHTVSLTAATRDGGKDVLVAAPTDLGEFLYLVECKHHAPDRPVGVSLVRELYGVVESKRATAGLLVTSSYFTRDAMKFREPLKHRMSLRDYNDLSKWIREATQLRCSSQPAAAHGRSSAPPVSGIHVGRQHRL